MQTLYGSIADDHAGRLKPFADDFFRTILFDGDLAVTDAYWYGHEKLLQIPEHVILACLRNGVVKPYFSDFGETKGSFSNGMNVWTKRTGVSPVNGAQDRAKFLDDELSRNNEGYKPEPWPKVDKPEDLLGARFLSQVETDLSKPDQPSDPSNEQLREAWEATGSWRRECVYRAVEMARNSTLQRNKLLIALGEDIADRKGESKDWTDRINNDVKIVREHLPGSGMEEYFDDFYAWVLHCYHVAQANAFGVDRLYFPSVGGQQLIPLARLKQERQNLGEVHICAASLFFPTTEALLKAKIDDLLAVRREQGGEYFSKLAAYQRQPASETAAEEAASALEQYGKELRDRFSDGIPDHLEYLQGRFPKLHGQARAAIKVINEITGYVFKRAAGPAINAKLESELGVDMEQIEAGIGGATGMLEFFYYGCRPELRTFRGITSRQITWQTIKPSDTLAVTELPRGCADSAER